MNVVYSECEIRGLVDKWHHNNLTVALVPTMGALHEGHLSLVELASSSADRAVVSIFVNPAQFGPGEDLSEYPRNPEDDIKKLGDYGVDAAFLPTEDVVYPSGFATKVDVTGITDTLCGRYRPDFFSGVATVCAVLFRIVRPDFAVFGRKDAQQFAVIKRIVEDLRLDVEIIAGPIIRESDGLAMSSRNRYLTPKEREQACGIYHGLICASEAYHSGVADTKVLKQTALKEFEKNDLLELQYLEIVGRNTMQPVKEIDGTALMAVAVYVGKTRLIDNVLLSSAD